MLKKKIKYVLFFGIWLATFSLSGANPLFVTKMNTVFPETTQDSLWTFSDAWQHKNSCREKVCLNGYWQWLPDSSGLERGKVPPQTSPWCYFKVPGYWPGHGNISAQKVVYDPQKTPPEPEHLFAAWYRRTVDVPKEWSNRNVLIELDQVDSEASVYVNGRYAGKILFPGGDLEIGKYLIHGEQNELSILVSVLEFGTMAEYMAQDRVFQQKKKVSRCGLTGDVFLSAVPRKGFLAQVHFQTSVRKKEIAFATEILNLSAGRYQLSAEVSERGKQ